MSNLTHRKEEKFIRLRPDQPEPGQYWRCTKTGEVRMISKVKYVDGAPHTIELRLHPSTEKEWDDSILINKFYLDFSYEPDGEQLREQEIAEIQAVISKLQSEMNTLINEPLESPRFRIAAFENSSLPTTNTHIITTEMWDNVSRGINSEEGMLALISSGRLSQELLEDLNSRANNHLVVAETKHQMVSDKNKEIGDQMRLMGYYFKERSSLEYAKTHSTRKKINDLLKGIQNLDLYLGKDVIVTPIREGERTTGAQPLHLFQAKRYIDEEISVFTEFDQGHFDFKHQEDFYRLLQDNPEFVNSMLPVGKCLRVVAWRRYYKEYSNSYESYGKNKENVRSWLLFRDGENIWAIDSPIGSHDYANTLFATQREMAEIFKAITINDTRFADKLDEQDAKYLHYKRFAILLCGLHDRLGLLGQLPADASNGRLFLPAVQEKVYVFIHDAEKDFMLGRGLANYSEWIQSKNQFLQNGSRVAVLGTDHILTSTAAPGAWPGYRESSYSPSERVIIDNVSRKGDDLVVTIPCAHIYTRKPRNITLALNKISASSQEILCLDTVTTAELTNYIHDRASRKKYMEYMPLFKEVKAILQPEEELLKPLTQHFKELMTAGGIGVPQKYDEHITEAIRIWRVARQFRMPPLLNSEDFAGFEKELCDILFSLAGHGRNLPAEIEEFVRNENRLPLRLTSNGKNQIFVYATPKSEEIEGIVTKYPWTMKYHLRLGKHKISVLSKAFVSMQAVNSKEMVLHEWSEAKEYYVNELLNYTLQDLIEIQKAAKNYLADWDSFQYAGASNQDIAAILTSYRLKINQLRKNDKYLHELVMRVPLGYIEFSGRLHIVYLGQNATVLLLSGDSTRKAIIEKWYEKRYASKVFDCLSTSWQTLSSHVKVEPFNKTWMEPTVSEIYGSATLNWGASLDGLCQEKTFTDTARSNLSWSKRELESMTCWFIDNIDELIQSKGIK